MGSRHQTVRRAFTLLEVSLVVGLILLLTAVVVPNFLSEIRRDKLPRSARNLRSLITLVRANAAFDGKRYRIRFPNVEAEEKDPLDGDNQPIIEREDDPIDHPEEFNLVDDPWAIGTTLLEDVWCARVRLGRPTIETIRRERESAAQDVSREFEEAFDREDFELAAERPPVFIEPDGTSEWVTFVLTTAPKDIDIDSLYDHPRVDVIVEGATGMAWIQRPFYDEELDLFEERRWPAVLRQDFLDERVLTEEDVLEIRETNIRGYEVELKGRDLEAADAKREDGP